MRLLRISVGTLVVLVLSTIAPASATATSDEPSPTFVTQWGGFQEPNSVAIDPQAGDVYVVGWDGTVRKFTSTGAFIASWAGSDESRGVAVDSEGHVYVTDRFGNQVQKFSPNGDLIMTWGMDGTGDGEFQGPTGIAVDPDTDDVYVADHGNNRIQKFTSTGTFITSWSGGIRYPEDVEVDPGTGDVYVVEGSWDPHRVWRFTSTGSYLNDWGTIGSAAGEFNQPMAIAVDSTGDVYVADSGNDRIQKFTAEGSFISKWGTGGTGKGEFDWPSGLAIDAAGDIFVADTMNDRIQKFGYRGRPDGRIQRGSGAMVGDDIYNTTGKGQSRKGSAARGKSVTYFASIQNDAVFGEQLRLKGQGSNSRFAVVYRDESGNKISKAVLAGTYTTPELQPGETYKIKIAVTVKKAAPRGASLARILTAISTTHSAQKDTVRFVTSRK